MRTRTRTLPVVIPPGRVIYRRYDNVPTPITKSNSVVETFVSDTPAYSAGLIQGSETITDELPLKKREGYVQHSTSKVTYHVNDEPVEVETFAGIPPTIHTWTVSGGYLAYDMLRTRQTLLLPVLGTPAVDWRKWSYYALKTMKPRFSDLSLANSLLELEQVKGLIAPYGAAKSRLGKLSNTILWDQFGVAPTVSDMVGVYRLIRDLPKKIADIRRRASRLQTRHFACPIELSGGNTLDTDLSAVIGEGGTFREVKYFLQRRWTNMPTYHATLRFRYDVSSLSDLELYIQAWAQAFGIDKPLNVAWNAIPFSFVVDWFVNVGEWISSLQAEPVLPIVIESFSHSVKYSYRTDVSISYIAGHYYAPLATAEYTYYERKPDLPALTAPWEFNVPSLEQFILGGALLVQGAESRARARDKNPNRKPPTPKWLKFGSNIPSNQIR